MTPRPQQEELALSRLVAPAARPQRQMLPLPDGYQTPVYVYGAPGASTQVPVLYLHGIQSHPGWFVGSCVHLAGLGHRVFAVCRRGSGDNTRHRGHAASAGQLLDDVETAGRYVLDATGQPSLALVGISWGGKLAACYAASPQRKIALASLTLVAPGIVPRVDVGLVAKLGIGLALLVAPQRRFDIPLNEVELFTDNVAMRGYLRADRHRLMRATARFFYASSQLDGMLRPAAAITVPTTLILATSDRIIDNARTRRTVERMTAAAAQVVTLRGAHTLEFEEDATAFYQALAAAVRKGGESAR
jgi:acylglycerol lipase